MTKAPVIPFLAALLVALAACSPQRKEEDKPAGVPAGEGVLLTVGGISIHQSDLDLHIRESTSTSSRPPTREAALEALASRARLAQAAIDAGLLEDPVVRSEFSRVLASRLKEKELSPRLRSIAETDIPDSRLRDLYNANLPIYQANEKRQAAVLWLNPGKNPERAIQYASKLNEARDWYLQNKELHDHPEQGFSVLAVDHSEHASSRFRNGDVGWLEQDPGPDSWNRAVSEILFSLPAPGAVSDVVTRAEGVFLVRYMAAKPASTRSFESVKDELSRSEKQRLRDAAEAEFESSLTAKYPVRHPSP